MSQLSLKYLGTTIQRQIQSSISEPFQSAVADIKSLWAAVFGGTGNIVSGTITADNVVTDTISEETTAAGVTVDGALLKDGGVSNVGGTILAGFYPIGAQQALSGPGAVNLTSYFTCLFYFCVCFCLFDGQCYFTLHLVQGRSDRHFGNDYFWLAQA